MSPFKSKAQARYLYSQEPEIAEEFASKTKSFKNLPERVEMKKKDKAKSERFKILRTFKYNK